MKSKKKYHDEIDLNDYDLSSGRRVNLKQLNQEVKEKKNKDSFLHMRIEGDLVDKLKKMASEDGLTYQPYIHRLLTLHVNGDLLDAKTIKKLAKKAVG